MAYAGISRGPLTSEQVKNAEKWDYNYVIGYPAYGDAIVRCRHCDCLWPMPQHKDGCPMKDLGS